MFVSRNKREIKKIVSYVKKKISQKKSWPIKYGNLDVQFGYLLVLIELFVFFTYMFTHELIRFFEILFQAITNPALLARRKLKKNMAKRDQRKRKLNEKKPDRKFKKMRSSNKDEN